MGLLFGGGAEPRRVAYFYSPQLSPGCATTDSSAIDAAFERAAQRPLRQHIVNQKLDML